MPSPRLLQLRASIAELRKLLLPHRFDPTGSYAHASRVRAKTLSFRILAHAEVESYFEDRVVEIAKTALKEWKQSGYVSRVTLHLVGFSGREMGLPPETLQAPNLNKKKNWDEAINVSSRLENSVKDYVYKVTKQNHGIKEQNIMAMLLPVGFPPDRCDQLLITNLSQFGEDRGLIAHSSGNTYVRQSVDPKDEYVRLEALLKDLMPVDDELTKLLAAAALPRP